MIKLKFGKPLCRSIIAVAIMMLSLQAMAYDFSYTHQGKTLYYKILAGNTNTVAVTYYSASDASNNHVSGDVVIPSSVEHNNVTYSVTSIGDTAFSGCSGLTSVTIGNSVTSIGNKAFYGCRGLTSVTIPNSVTSIGNVAFWGCSGLTSVTIPNSVTSIGNSAFYGCSGLTSVTIPNSVTSIGEFAFYACSGLTSVTIPNSVTTIGESAFSACSSLNSINVASGNTHYSSIDGVLYNYVQDTLIECPGAKTSVTIPNSVTSIGNEAFYGCRGLTSVTIPNSVTSIGYSAFSWCSSLTSVTIPNSVTSIRNSAFSACSGLTSINVASGNTHYSLIDGVLYNYVQDTLIQCPGAKTSVTIPNSVTSIRNWAFYGCRGLTSVTIPNSVTSIGERAFYGCRGLTSVTIPNSVTSIGERAFYGCRGLTSVTIGNSVTSIGYSAFSCCSSLTSVTIGNSLTSIGYRAFYECLNLSSLISLATVPPTIDNETFPYPNTCMVTVPCGSLEAYTTSDWNTYFATRISEDLSFELSVSANDEAYGRVEVETQSCEVATITATPNEGYEFTAWNDGNTENPRTVTITSDTAFMAIFTASGSSSLQEVNAREFALYPNPAKRFVTLEFEALKENTLLQILDLNGRKVRTVDLKAGIETLRIDLGDLPKGVYTVMLGNTTKKLIVE